MSTFRLFRLLLWVHWRSFLSWRRVVQKDSPLLLWVLGGLVVGYIGIGYWLFFHGLNFLVHFPLVGSVLSQRLLYLVFWFFFLMLICSNIIIGYTTLYRNRETAWLLTLPIPHQLIYRWKFGEALVVSSWALIFLSAPMMLAFGHVNGAGPLFYLLVALVYLPFVVIPALLGSWLTLALARIMASKTIKRLLLGAFIIGALALVFGLRPVSDAETVSTQEMLTFEQLLRHTRGSMSPYLPSSWLAQAILAWADDLTEQGGFFFLMLVSNALMGLLLSFEFIGRFYYGSWAAALSSRAGSYHRKAAERRLRESRPSLPERLLGLLKPISRPGAALILKDARLFWRDPTQWSQFMIFFGLLCIYVFNLRHVAMNFQNPFWEIVISYLNLASSALTLSTLTTRFVFPQFSLEGRRIWILGLAPMGLPGVLKQKFWMSCLGTMSMTVTLMIVSSLMLKMPWDRVAFFTCTIAIMCCTLSGLAVGLGAIFPNFREENPSKIVSGFGGTLCLVMSFIYIALAVSLAALPDVLVVMKAGWAPLTYLAPAAGLILSALILFVPLTIASRRVKSLEI